jgi:uncharacterized protein YkwD
LRSFLVLVPAFVFVFSVTGISQERPKPILVAEIGAKNRVRSEARPSVATSSGNLSRESTRGLEKHVFDLINAERAARGLARLKWDNQVAEVARLHSRNMAVEKFFGHRGSDGSMVDSRADKIGLRNWNAIGENIAFMRGYDDPAELAVEKWLNSTSHRKNLLSPQWNESAIGIAMTEDGTYYLTQVFLNR